MFKYISYSLMKQTMQIYVCMHSRMTCSEVFYITVLAAFKCSFLSIGRDNLVMKFFINSAHQGQWGICRHPTWLMFKAHEMSWEDGRWSIIKSILSSTPLHLLSLLSTRQFKHALVKPNIFQIYLVTLNISCMPW